MAKRIYYYTHSRDQGPGQILPASVVISAAGTVSSTSSVLMSSFTIIDSEVIILSTASVLMSSSATIGGISSVNGIVRDAILDRARLSEILRAWVENPTGCWNDYNAAWKTWKILRAYGGNDHIVTEEEALSINEPRTIDYEDLRCQGYYRARMAKKARARISSVCSVMGNMRVDGWVGGGKLDIECNSVVSSFASNFIKVSASIEATSYCQGRRIPDEQTIDYFTHILAEPVRNKSNHWSDYNTQYKRYQNLLKLVNIGLMKVEDLPAKPRVEDYAELI